MLGKLCESISKTSPWVVTSMQSRTHANEVKVTDVVCNVINEIKFLSGEINAVTVNRTDQYTKNILMNPPWPCPYVHTRPIVLMKNVGQTIQNFIRRDRKFAVHCCAVYVPVRVSPPASNAAGYPVIGVHRYSIVRSGGLLMRFK